MSSVKVCRPYIDDGLTDDQRPTTDLLFRKFRMTISQRRVIRSTSCLVLGYVSPRGQPI